MDQNKLSKIEIEIAVKLGLKDKQSIFLSDIQQGYCGKFIGDNKALCFICQQVIESYQTAFATHIREHTKKFMIYT